MRAISSFPFEECPGCGRHRLIIRRNRETKHIFVGCLGFGPIGCRYTENLWDYNRRQRRIRSGRELPPAPGQKYRRPLPWEAARLGGSGWDGVWWLPVVVLLALLWSATRGACQSGI